MTKGRFATLLLTLSLLGACGANPVSTPPDLDLVAKLKTRPNLAKFAKALETTGVGAELLAQGDYTVFAPMDSVLDGPLDRGTVRHHVLAERVTFSDIAGETLRFRTLHTDEIEIEAKESIKVGDGFMVESDILASNGVIHVIDKALTPGVVPKSLTPGLSTGGFPEPAPDPAETEGPAALTPDKLTGDGAPFGLAGEQSAPTAAQ